MEFNTDSVIDRLKTFGYESSADDVFALDFSISKVADTIKNETNQSDVPDCLLPFAIDMACGEFLQVKRTFSQDSLNLDLDKAIKQISVGDTSTTFDFSACQTADQKLNAFINALLGCGKPHYSRYRKLVW